MLSKSDYRSFEKAKQVADISDYKRIHVGCVAIYHDNIIGIGCNTNKTHPRQEYYNQYREIVRSTDVPYLPKLHAEISCLNSIRNLNINFSKVKLYVYRKCTDRPHGIARPCPSCMAAIRDLGIKNIYYTTDTGFAYEKVDDECEVA